MVDSERARRAGREADDGAAGSLPEAWDDLVGYDETLSSWRRLVGDDRLPPVILLTGRAGLGKRALLAALAAMHVCETGAACGACEQCRWLLAGAHPEVLWIQGEKSERGDGKILMDAAEAVQDHLSLAAGSAAKARLAIIVDADELTTQAANRLLKTLEETPDRTRILLSTSRVDALLPTVLSRCVRWRISPPPVAASRAWLARRLAARGVPVPADVELERTLKQSGLAPGLALAAYASLGTTGQDEAGGEVRDGADMVWLTGASAGRLGRGQALADAEAWVKASGASVGDLLTRLEISLNEDYASIVGGSCPEVGLVWRRRATLREAKALALRSKVPLNAQLIAERLALSGAP